ncbi:uncharacterized protein J3R85_012379 [Psidium guajava]|nr:uncharacterized protein J3R85_012379 [Psidium guajava]
MLSGSALCPDANVDDDTLAVDAVCTLLPHPCVYLWHKILVARDGELTQAWLEPVSCKFGLELLRVAINTSNFLVENSDTEEMTQHEHDRK